MENDKKIILNLKKLASSILHDSKCIDAEIQAKRERFDKWGPKRDRDTKKKQN